MLKIRPYKPCDARNIVSWVKDETTFIRWSAGKFGDFPAAAEDINRFYSQFDDTDNFYPFTAFDENGAAGHFIMRFTNREKTVLRFGFIIVDDAKRGMGYGRQMLTLAMEYAFRFLGVEKVTLGVFEDNTAAYMCYKSLGFKESVPQTTEYYYICGKKRKCIELYALEIPR